MLPLVFTACRKEENTFLQGTFKGTLAVIPAKAYSLNPVQLVLYGKNYECVTGRGGGTFAIRGINRVEFKDIHAWTADFDWNLILSGTYDYKIKGDSLILTKDINGSGRYQYKLLKIAD